MFLLPMKKILLASISLGIVTSAVADIQSPPGAQQNSIRKLSRGVANILYGWTEIPASTIYDLEMNSTYSSMAFANGPIRGFTRTAVRVGWGFYEVATFPLKSYKGKFDQPYVGTVMKPRRGFQEFPPEIGFLSASKYSRQTLY